MRRGILAAALALLTVAAAGAPAADPPLPPIVFQTQPVGRILDELRNGARMIGDEKGAKAFNDSLKQTLGDKGLEGLDVGRPVVGYVVLAPRPEDITAVVAIPVTGEKEFLDLCERLSRQKPTLAPKEQDLYVLPSPDSRYKAMLRFRDRYAYIAYGHNPVPQMDPKLLVPMAKLFEPREEGLVAARVHFDRIPLAVKIAAPVLLEEVKKTVFGGLALGNQEKEILKPALAELDKLLARYGKLALGAESLAARVMLDPMTAELTVEAILSGKPDSDLARIIAAHKPHMNKFGALLGHPDTVAGVKLRLPLFEEEFRSAAALGLDSARKEALKNAPMAARDFVEELFKGLARTAKTGEFDLAAAVRGPDKNGWYTAVGAIAFEDTAKLEKEFKTYIAKELPPEIVNGIKWDAAKAGTVNIHTRSLNNLGLIEPGKILGGEDCQLAFAFAPHGVFIVVGPDAITTIKDAIAVKPVAAPVLEVLANPVQIGKLIQKVAGPENAGQIEAVLGKEDRLISALSANLVGGKELKLSVKINMKVLPRALGYVALDQAAPGEVPVPVPEKK